MRNLGGCTGGASRAAAMAEGTGGSKPSTCTASEGVPKEAQSTARLDTGVEDE